MNVPATLANLAWFATSLPAHRRFACSLRDPVAAQSRWLRSHLRRNGGSAYGRAHGGGEIRSYADFVRQVPVVSYDDLAPWIGRIRAGETGVLTREPVTRLVPTSGSSGGRKLIPYTASLQREFNAAIDPWHVDLCRQDPTHVLGPAYWSVTPFTPAHNTEESAVPIGFDDDSRFLGGARAWLVNAVMAVPASVRNIPDIESFRYVVLLSLLRRSDLRFISVWHPSFLSLLLDSLPGNWDALLADLQAGRCRAGHLEPGFDAAGRAKRLRTCDPTRPETLWPALRKVSCWADANACSAAAVLQARLPGIAVQPKGLLATEAFVTLPFAGAHPLAINSHFFEFENDRGQVCPLEGVRTGGIYEVIVTTGGGLWRYRLGDRVEVMEYVGRTPSLRFVGRSGIVSDRCGEKLAEGFVAGVLAACCPSAAFAILAPEAAGSIWRYVLFVETAAGTPDANRLDAALRANPHYGCCRDLGQLAPAAVQTVTRGYETYASAEMERGLRLGDIKPAALSLRTGWTGRFAPMVTR